MKNEIIYDYIKRLELAISQGNIIDAAYEVTEILTEHPDAYLAVNPILKLLDNNPDVDFGAPGPLVHFAERFYQNGMKSCL